MVWHCLAIGCFDLDYRPGVCLAAIRLATAGMASSEAGFCVRTHALPPAMPPDVCFVPDGPGASILVLAETLERSRHRLLDCHCVYCGVARHGRLAVGTDGTAFYFASVDAGCIFVWKEKEKLTVKPEDHVDRKRKQAGKNVSL